MNPLVDHRTIYDTCLKGPAAVIRLFEDAFGKFAVWEPPTPHQLQDTIDYLHEEQARLRARIARLEEELRAERHQNFVLSRKVGEPRSAAREKQHQLQLAAVNRSTRGEKDQKSAPAEWSESWRATCPSGDNIKTGGAARSGTRPSPGAVSSLWRVARRQ